MSKFLISAIGGSEVTADRQESTYLKLLRCGTLAGLVVGSILLGFPGLTSAQYFTGLGDLPGGLFQSTAIAVSADGSVVVGESVSATGYEAFRWTREGGIVGLGDLSPQGLDTESGAFGVSGVSADGSVVVGTGRVSVNSNPLARAFRWTEESGMMNLGVVSGNPFPQSFANAVSSDGTVVVGSSDALPFRWTLEDGMVLLGDLLAGSTAFGVSGDGSVIVGEARILNVSQAFRWTSDGGTVLLGALPGGPFTSSARAVSADGKVIVGVSESSFLGSEAFRWTEEGAMVGLGGLPGGRTEFASAAFDVSGDGSVIVGRDTSARRDPAIGDRAFIWDAEHGMRDLRTVLINNYGLGDALEGWKLRYAYGVSDDGLSIVGQGVNPDGFVEAWLADLRPRSVAIDINPGSFPNSINPKSKGVIPVAILTTPTFDATTVDPLSVRFGPKGAVEAHGRGHIKDADGDGDLDLVLHFRTQDTGIQCGDTSASLTGETFSGQMIQGSDSIKTVGCK